MKILSHKYTSNGNMIVVTTDNHDRPEFVYFKGQFRDMVELKREIIKSIHLSNLRAEVRNTKIDLLDQDLEDSYARN